MTPADFLTVLRLVLVPLFLWAFLAGDYSKALAFFAVAGFTDLVDGTVARLLKKQTRLGAILDPIADKALMAATFACLWMARIIPWWFFLLVIGRDLMIVGGLAYLQWRKIDAALKPYWTSKWATLFQIATVVFGMTGFLKPAWQLLGWPLSDIMSFFLAAATLLIAISGIQYFLRGIKILQRHAQTTH